jgi:hypothetical protein
LGLFADRAKNGAGKTVEALKMIKDGGEAVSWLMENMPTIVDGLGTLLKQAI